MADNPATNKVINPDDIVIVDLFNPTRARRIIFDGIGKMPKSIVVESGATKQNVRIHRMIETELVERNRVKKDSDLIPTKVETTQAA